MKITVGTGSTSLTALLEGAGYTLESRVLYTNTEIKIQNLGATDIFVSANIAATIADGYKVVATTGEITIKVDAGVAGTPKNKLSKIFLISSVANADVRILENY